VRGSQVACDGTPLNRPPAPLPRRSRIPSKVIEESPAKSPHPVEPPQAFRPLRRPAVSQARALPRQRAPAQSLSRRHPWGRVGSKKESPHLPALAPTRRAGFIPNRKVEGQNERERRDDENSVFHQDTGPPAHQQKPDQDNDGLVQHVERQDGFVSLPKPRSIGIEVTAGETQEHVNHDHELMARRIATGQARSECPEVGRP